MVFLAQGLPKAGEGPVLRRFPCCGVGRSVRAPGSAYEVLCLLSEAVVVLFYVFGLLFEAQYFTFRGMYFVPFVQLQTIY